MKTLEPKGCLIDVIAKEAVLIKANIKTLPYALTIFDTLTGKTFGHACLLFQYKNDTWNYDSLYGSVKVFPNELTNNIGRVAEKTFSLIPNYEIKKVLPIAMCTMFPEDTKEIEIGKHYEF